MNELDLIGSRYVRAEVLAGFVNGLFLIFTAFFIFSEGVEVTNAHTSKHAHTHIQTQTHTECLCFHINMCVRVSAWASESSGASRRSP